MSPSNYIQNPTTFYCLKHVNYTCNLAHIYCWIYCSSFAFVFPYKDLRLFRKISLSFWKSFQMAFPWSNTTAIPWWGFHWPLEKISRWRYQLSYHLKDCLLLLNKDKKERWLHLFQVLFQKKNVNNIMTVFYIVTFNLWHPIAYDISLLISTWIWIIFLKASHCISISKTFNFSEIQSPCT